MKHRQLRIVWSVVWGVVAVMLVALLARSYWTYDKCWWPGNSFGVQINSLAGRIVLIVGPLPNPYVPFYIDHLPTRRTDDPLFDGSVLGFYFQQTPRRLRLDIPLWFMSLISLALAITPWFRTRFSLRTLLIVTTLVAVGLGLTVWLTR